MKNSLLFNFEADKGSNCIYVKREFDAPIHLVWDAWTKPELLDQWWAPKPYVTRTKSMNFTDGGTWLYCMVSPTNEVHWCKADYSQIHPQKSYHAVDAFCDEHGVLNSEIPRSHWDVSFQNNAEQSIVSIKIQYESLAHLEQIISLGFKEGFTMAMGNLDAYFEAQFKLRAFNKTNNQARVCTYVNFPGNTEEAMLFYQQIFKTQFTGQGIQRFGDLPADPTQAPMSESLKQMVLHAELPLIGGHILMATDAPTEMGFNVVQGNNMHISLEPESKEEADRLFNELSVNGKVSMPIQEMFWGAYFGSFTDQYGINWMVNYLHPKD
jgi:PhnB protein